MKKGQTSYTYEANIDELRERVAALTPQQREYLALRIKREKEQRRVIWDCGSSNCNGSPHPSHPTPHARLNQRLPFKPNDRMLGALWLAGRGYGKTRVGAEGIRKLVSRKKAPTYGRIGLIGRTISDVRDVMIQGDSGLLACYPKWDRPEYIPSKRIIRFQNGAVGFTYSADKPDQLRGPQHDLIWGDEVSTWPKLLDVKPESGKPGPEGVLTNALLGLRLGTEPRAILTGTPKRTRDMKYLVTMKSIYIVKGTTYENTANLAPIFRDIIIAQYEGTRVGRQELMGELLSDVEGALLTSEFFEHDGFRLEEDDIGMWPTVPTVTVVGVDPATTVSDTSDYTGLSVCSTDAFKRQGYVRHSERVKASPFDAMTRAVKLYHRFNASAVIAETNNGGDYVKTVIHQIDPSVRVRKVHAAVGKKARAEPVAGLYEQRRMHHVGHPQNHAALEDEWTGWVPDESDESPDVMDSEVWAVSKIMLKAREEPGEVTT